MQLRVSCHSNEVENENQVMFISTSFPNKTAPHENKKKEGSFGKHN